jgi:site-specific DNA recombinase
VAKLADVQGRSQEVRRRLAEVESGIAALEAEQISESEIQAALADFDGVWEALQPREQARIIELLVESVVWDAEAESIAITFRPTGIKTLAGKEEAA